MPMTREEQAEFDKMKEALTASNLKNEELTKSGEKQLEDANKTSAEKLNAANSKASLLSKYDLKEVDEALKLKREAKVNGLKASGEYDKALAAHQEEAGKVVAAEKERADGFEKRLEENIVGRALDEAISKAGGNVKPLRAVIGAENTIKSVEVNGATVVQVFAQGSESPRVKDKTLTPLTLDDLVSGYRESSDTAGLFAATKTSGTGARTSVLDKKGSNIGGSLKEFKGNLTEEFKDTAREYWRGRSF